MKLPQGSFPVFFFFSVKSCVTSPNRAGLLRWPFPPLHCIALHCATLLQVISNRVSFSQVIHLSIFHQSRPHRFRIVPNIFWTDPFGGWSFYAFCCVHVSVIFATPLTIFWLCNAQPRGRKTRRVRLWLREKKREEKTSTQQLSPSIASRGEKAKKADMPFPELPPGL